MTKKELINKLITVYEESTLGDIPLIIAELNRLYAIFRGWGGTLYLL